MKYNTKVFKWNNYYEDIENVEDWLECPVCGIIPKIFDRDYVRQVQCACSEGDSEILRRTIVAEPIGYFVKRTGGFAGYDENELMNNWNNWVKSFSN